MTLEHSKRGEGNQGTELLILFTFNSFKFKEPRVALAAIFEQTGTRKLSGEPAESQ